MTTRRYHANELERRTRLRTLEGQARILLNDLAEYGAWLEYTERPPDRARRGGRALAPRGLPADAGADRPARSARTATSSRRTATCSSTSGCSRSRPGSDVGLDAAIESYLAEGAPAPEVVVTAGGAVTDPLAGLDIESAIADEDGLIS